MNLIENDEIVTNHELCEPVATRSHSGRRGEMAMSDQDD